jgi:acyl-coenzyme A synthetase/AMP-(fatty) acid ligase
VLRTHPSVCAAAVVGVPDAGMGQIIAAVVVLSSSGPSSAPGAGGVSQASRQGGEGGGRHEDARVCADLVRHCRAALSPYKVSFQRADYDSLLATGVSASLW